MSGWIKLSRKIIDWEWYTDSTVKSLFLHCLIEANHKSKTWRGIEIQRGQFVTSIESLKSKTGISNQSLRTALNKLKSTGEITIKSTSRFTLISVTNYDAYQCEDDEANKPANKQLTNNQQTTNKQLTTTKNEKNEKNDKNDKKIRKERASPPFDINSHLEFHLNNSEGHQAIADWLDHKKQIGKPYKPLGLKSFIEGINRDYQNSAQLAEAVRHSRGNNYQGLFKPKNQTQLGGKKTHSQKLQESFELIEHFRGQ